MGSSERLCLRWNDFESNIKHGFSELREEEDFFDVTLACGTKQIKAHKVILSACSPFFRSIIKAVPHQHPLLYLRGIKFAHLESLLAFMYNGEVNVTQEDLNNFLSVAEELQIKGLTQSNTAAAPPASSSSSQGGPPPSKRPRMASSASKLAPPPSSPQGNTPSNAAGNNVGGTRSRLHTASATSSSVRPSMLEDPEDLDDDDIQELPSSVVKAEPKDGVGGGSNTMVVTPDVSLTHEEHHLEHDPYAQEEDNYEDYAQYGSDSGDISYGAGETGGALLDAGGMAAVPGPSGAANPADGNKGGGEAIIALDSAINRLIMRNAAGFTCKKCGKTSSQRTCLRNHIEAKHIQTDGFRCTLCSRVFKTRNSLSVHTSTKHTNATPYISGTRDMEQQMQHKQEVVYDVPL